jgi:hypothetical protein
MSNSQCPCRRRVMQHVHHEQKCEVRTRHPYCSSIGSAIRRPLPRTLGGPEGHPAVTSRAGALCEGIHMYFMSPLLSVFQA